MPKGLYREPGGWVQVDLGKIRISIPRKKYEASGYEPPYDQLPTKEEYEKAVSRTGAASDGANERRAGGAGRA